MPTILQLRRGTTAENAAYTGAAGEITVDTTLNKVLLHDGSTAGGAATVGNLQGNIQLGKTAAGEIDTSSGNLTIDSAGGTVTVDDNLVVSGNLTVSGTTTTVDSTTISIQNAFVFEGATDDAFETTLTTVDPTADRTISLPNATGTIVLQDTTDTLTNKTIALGSNTVSGTTAQFNSALSDGSFATLAGTETLTNKTLTSAVLNTAVSGSAILDEDDLSSNSATQLATQQSIKAYVDAQVTASDLDFQADSGGALSIDLDSETMTFTGGTGIDTSGSGNAVTFAIDSTVATLTGTQTLTNKTINTASNTITIVEADISDLQSYITASSSDTLTNKTIALGSNTVSGTTAQFNSALSDGSFVTLAGTETLTNKSLTSPTITGTGAIAGTFTGNITGDVTGNADTATTLATARNIGGVSFDGSANIDLPGVNTTGNQNTSGSAATLTTARTIAGQSFDGSANITIAATDLSDTNQSLATSDNVSFANLTLSGNLTVNGTTTTVATTNTTITDNLLELNSGAGSNANDSGILIERGSTGDNAIMAWDESADKFIVGTTTATNDATGNLSITTGTLVANVEGNVTGNVTGDVTGNADTATLAADATTLATARTIAGQSFDGSANITIASTDLSNTSSIALLTATQTLTNKTIAAGSNTISGITSSHFASAVTLVINDSSGSAVKTIVGSAS